MASAVHLPRFLLPRGNGSPAMACIDRRLKLAAQQPTRHASSTASKPRVLQKPAKFTPPSHPARLNRSPPRSYPGPPPSKIEQEAQKTRQYPHMMPPDGSFMHWFLTNRSIHIWITLGTLGALATFTFLENFSRTSPFEHMLPAMGEWLRHPWRSAGMVVEVARLHTAYVSAETVERRKRGIEDVTKRREFRKAHGLEEKRSGDEEVENTIATPTAVVATQEPGAGREAGSGVYTDWEGKRKPVKKWLGIW